MSDSMTVLVEYQVRAETTTREAWLETWRARAEDAEAGEPGTSAYGALVNVDEPLNILVFERYSGGAESLKAHVERPAHQTLLDTMGAAKMTKRRVFSTRADDLPHGWWQPAGGPRSQEGVYLTILNMRFRDAEHRTAFLAMADEHMAWCESNEPDSLIMGIGETQADADRELDLKASDLMFVNGYASEAALRTHHDSPEHVAFSDAVKAAGFAPENFFYRTYVSTGVGFLWRD